MNPAGIDIFCHVIDNYGDAGVVYRFAKGIKKCIPNCEIRVFIDNIETLASIEPLIDKSKQVQTVGLITFVNSQELTSGMVESLGIAEVLIEAFACEIPNVVYDIAVFKSKLIVNLDYLSAESWVEEYHLQQSLLNVGTAKKYFFMPGFTTSTGGLILNSAEVEKRVQNPESRKKLLSSVLEACGCNIDTDSKNVIFGTVFSYERGFDNLLESLTKVDYQVCLIVLGDKSHKSMRDTLSRFGERVLQKVYVNYKNIHICFSKLLQQELYDSLLYCTDFNLVRGEDSLVRAVCSGKPFVWNAYIQEKKYQTVKVDAFLEYFRQYFDDLGVFERYKQLMFSYNNAPDEKTMQVTDENFYYFISDLNKIEHATANMSYFIANNCNLVKNFCDFLREFKIS